jgi:hypothetical protein
MKAITRWPSVAVALLVGAVAFLYRFLGHDGFSNDHFVHLSRAQAMLLGDWPIRDYTEEGVPLTVLMSAAAQRLVGEAPFAELLWVTTSIAIAAAVTCWLVSELTRSRLLGVFAAALQVAIMPRLYSHPKMLVYPVLLTLALWYVRHPSRRRLALVAAWTGVAFLLRHDHGVYSGIAGVATVIAGCSPLRLRDALRYSAEYVSMVALVVSPYLVYVQYQIGIVEYLRIGVAISQTENRSDRPWPSFDPVASGPLLTRREVTERDLLAIRIRWAASVDDAERLRYEQQWGLQFPSADPDDPRTWSYRLDRPAGGSLAAIAAANDVDDVAGFDRRTATAPGVGERVADSIARAGLARLTVGPPVTSLFSTHNQLTYLFYLIWLLPLLALGLWWYRTKSPGDGRDRIVPVVAILAIACAAGFAREVTWNRIADTFGTFPILVAWLSAAAFQWRGSWPARLAGGVLGLVLLASTGAVTAHAGSAPAELEQSRVAEGREAVVQRFNQVVSETRNWPWSSDWPAGDDWQVAVYVHDCTRPEDRLLVTWNAPEFNFFSRRGFAGGETLLVPVFRSPAGYETAVMNRLRRQSVPIILGELGEWDYFAGRYPAIADHIARRYRRVGDHDFRAGHHIVVFVDKERTPTGVDSKFGWPCFVSQASSR